MLRCSMLQAFLVACLVFIQLTGRLLMIYPLLFILTCICSLVLFFLAYPIFKHLSRVLNEHKKQTRGAVQLHYSLHFVILTFLILDQLYGLSGNAMQLFAPFLIIFFLTAIILWRSCYAVLKSRIYQFFTLGSTALLLWTTALVFLGLFYQPTYLSGTLHFLLNIYFALHFAEVGFVLYKIERDLQSI